MARPLVCRVADVPENTLKECEAEGGRKLVVANAGGEFVAFQAMCPHQDVPLCEGLYDGSTLICHQHLWQWDITTGEAVGQAEAPLERAHPPLQLLQALQEGLLSPPLAGVRRGNARHLRAGGHVLEHRRLRRHPRRLPHA